MSGPTVMCRPCARGERMCDCFDAPRPSRDDAPEAVGRDAAPNPEGEMYFVPLNPTPEMVAAFWRQKNTGSQEPGQLGDDRSDFAAYRAMLSAAPVVLSPPPVHAGEAVAWRWEQWSSLVGAWTPRLTFDKPDEATRVRNVRALFDHPSSGEDVEGLREALERQTDNMSFILNRVDLHKLHDKFEQEMTEDRQLLAALSNRSQS